MTVEVSDVLKYLRMGGDTDDTALLRRIGELKARAEGVIRPARIWKRFPLSPSGIVSGGRTLHVSGTLAAHLDGCGDVYLVCGTIGAEFDAFSRKVSAVSGADALIVQAIGTAAIEDWMDAVGEEIRGELAEGESLTARYSPGYGDFPLSAQRTVSELLDAPRKTGVSVTDTLLMVPSKSVSAVIGVKRA